MSDIVDRLMEVRNRPFKERDRSSMTFAAGEIVKLREQLVKCQEALTFYRDEADAAGRYMARKYVNPDSLLAILTVLANDGGQRARAAMTENVDMAKPEHKQVAWRWRFTDETSWTLVHRKPDHADDTDVICQPLFTLTDEQGK